MTDTAQTRAASHEIARMWSGGWKRFVFPSVWLVYLGQTVHGVDKHSSGAAAVAGYAVVGIFAAAYLTALPIGWRQRGRGFWWLFLGGIALTGVECLFAQHDAFVFFTYLAVIAVAANAWWSAPAVGCFALVALVVPPLVPSWHAKADWDDAATVVLVGFAMFGFFHVIESNRELAAARSEVARLAAENERSRIARDLHDLLGHSLTTITVKAGLARRLGERGETRRALTEIGEVEQLSRRTLGDVRAAVSGHREVTLAGELATAREVLRAAAIVAELPGSVDVVDPDLSELFGWVVREGVTNIVRHSHADTCRIDLGRQCIEVADTGVGSSGQSPGNGLCGLRERVAAAGGTLQTSGGSFGFRLRVEVTAGVPSSPVQA